MHSQTKIYNQISSNLQFEKNSNTEICLYKDNKVIGRVRKTSIDVDTWEKLKTYFKLHKDQQFLTLRFYQNLLCCVK